MKIERLWLSSFLILLSLCLEGCKDLPKGPVCLIGDSGCLCHDPSLPENKQDYVINFEQCKNYVATSPAYYEQLNEWTQRNCK